MYDIAEIGEYVQYTGDVTHAYDSRTVDLMNSRLIYSEFYMVIAIVNYIGSGCMHYKFSEDPFLYPYKSFTKK